MRLGNKHLTAILTACCVGLVPGCGGDDEGGGDRKEMAVEQDACDLLDADLAREALGGDVTKESFESGIGPGCIYRKGPLKRVGINVQATTFEETEWHDEVVTSTLEALPPEEKARLKEVGGLGDAAYWIGGKKTHVLHVLDQGRAFDLFLLLGSRTSDEDHLEQARAFALGVLERLNGFGAAR